MINVFLERMLASKFRTSLLLFAIVLGFYGLLIPTGPVGLGNSDLLITQAYLGGLVNSPGYPVYMTILSLMVSSLSGVLGVAFAAHLLSAVLASATVVLVFQLSLLIYGVYHFKARFLVVSHDVTRLLLSLLTAGSVALANVFWRYSLLTSGHMLTVFLVTGVVYLTTWLMLNPKVTSSKYYFIWGSLVGVGLGHQWLMWPILLVSLYLLRDRLVKLSMPVKVAALALTIGAMVVPYGLLLPRIDSQTLFSRIVAPTYESIRDYVAEGYLGDGQALTTNLNLIVTTISVEQILNNAWLIIGYMYASMGIVMVLGIASILLYTTPPKLPNLIQALGLYSLATILALSAVIDWQPHAPNLHQAMPQMLVLHPLLALLGWFGFYELLTRITGALATLTQPKWARVFGVVVMIGAVFALAYTRWSDVSLEGKLVEAQVAQSILTSVEPDAIVACFSYSSCYSLAYQQEVVGLNQAVELVPFFYLPSVYNIGDTTLQGFDYDSYPMVMWDIVTWNRADRPIYSVDMFDNYFSLFGIDYGFLFYVPRGYFGQLTNQIPEQLPETDLQLSTALVGNKIPSWDKALEQAKIDMIRRHMFNTSIYLKSGLRQRGVGEVNIATSLGYDLDPRSAQEIATMRAAVETILPNRFYVLGSQAETVDFILEQAEELVQAGRPLRATQVVQGAVTLDPRNINARLKWAGLLESTLASQSAVLEYNHVLKLDPGNQEALDRLEYQRQLGVGG